MKNFEKAILLHLRGIISGTLFSVEFCNVCMALTNHEREIFKDRIFEIHQIYTTLNSFLSLKKNVHTIYDYHIKVNMVNQTILEICLSNNLELKSKPSDQMVESIMYMFDSDYCQKFMHSIGHII